VNPEPLPPIASPPEHYWRQFRIHVLPVFTFLLVLVATVWLWGRNLANPMVMGQAESVQADVSSPVPGRILRLNANLFQEVKAGDVIATIEAVQPLVLSNTVALVRAELEALRLNAGLDAGDRVRLADFRLSWMSSRADLTTAQAQLNWSQGEYDRVTKLATEKFVSQFDLDTALRDRDQFVHEVEQRSLAVATAEKAWRELDPATADTESPGLKSAIAVAEQNLRLAEAQLEPVVLVAPISGCISKLEKLAGATIVEGDPIVTIANPKADRIVGYLSQPLRIEPKVGMKAQIRSRGLIRTMGETQITLVGPRIELFDAPLRVRGMGAAQERGLPIIMDIPPNMQIRPGELVDIRLLIN
jgi:HlyD family secretion protein